MRCLLSGCLHAIRAQAVVPGAELQRKGMTAQVEAVPGSALLLYEKQ